MKKVICLLIVILISISCVPINISATEDDGMLYMDNYGVYIDDYVPNYPSESDKPQSSVNIPRYDPRDRNYTTPVKDQSPHGTCGIFASTASFEMTNYMLTGLKYQYSEEAVRFALSDSLMEVNGVNKATPSGYYKNTNSSAWNFAAATSYFSNINNPIITGNTIQWVAPNLLVDVPYTTNAVVSYGYWPENMNYSNANSFVSGTEFIRKDLIRDKIMQYGAVYTVFFCDPINDPDSYNGDTYSWYSLTNNANHAIAVVGWDDNYSRDNFNIDRIPPGDGAWLVKNSWGTNYGDDGYCWISYHDESFNYSNQAAVVTSVEPLSKNEYMLSYDYMPISSLPGIPIEYLSNVFYTCNVYDVSDYTDTYNSIDKVLFYSNCVGGTFEIYITSIDSSGVVPTVSDLTEVCASGSIIKDGYITVKLQDDYELNDDINKLAIIIKYVDDSDIYIPREDTSYGDDGHLAEINQGESYFSIGGEWLDVSSSFNDTDGNYCIRPILKRATPITQDSSLSLYSTYNQGTALPVTVNLNGNQLCSIKKGSTILYEGVAFDRNGNVVTFKESFMDEISTEKTHNITFSFTDGADQILQILPRQLSMVTISGNVAQGQTLTASAICNDGTVPPSQQLSYQWQSSSDGSTWTNIGGATSSIYTLTADERLEHIRCQVTVSNGNGMCSTTIFSAPTTTKVILYGDADLDGGVTSMDVTAIQKYLVKKQEFTTEQIMAADVDGDGQVSNLDTTYIQFFLANRITSFPVEE